MVLSWTARVDVPEPLVVIWSEVIPTDLESDVNRLLTEQRGLIYQRGTDLGRILSQANALGSSVSEILQKTADYLGVEAAVVRPREGVAFASSGFSAGSQEDQVRPLPAKGWIGQHFVSRLAGGTSLWLGSVPSDQRALSGLLPNGWRWRSSRLNLTRTISVRAGTRGRRHWRACCWKPPLEAGRVASSLGLPSNGVFQVVLAGPAIGSSGDPPGTQRRRNGP